MAQRKPFRKIMPVMANFLDHCICKFHIHGRGKIMQTMSVIILHAPTLYKMPKKLLH